MGRFWRSNPTRTMGNFDLAFGESSIQIENFRRFIERKTSIDRSANSTSVRFDGLIFDRNRPYFCGISSNERKLRIRWPRSMLQDQSGWPRQAGPNRRSRTNRSKRNR